MNAVSLELRAPNFGNTDLQFTQTLAQILAQLHIEVSTVKSHLARISPRLGVRDRVQLVVWAYRSGLVR